MKIVQILAMIATFTFAIKQIQLLLKSEINRCDEIPEIEEEEMQGM